MRRNVKELEAMLTKINNHPATKNKGIHLTMQRSPHGRNYTYLITEWTGVIGKPIVNWVWFAEAHGYLRAYMKDIEDSALIESKVEERIQTLKKTEWQNLMNTIEELRSELADAVAEQSSGSIDSYVKRISELEGMLEAEKQRSGTAYHKYQRDIEATSAEIFNLKAKVSEYSKTIATYSSMIEDLKTRGSNTNIPVGHVVVPTLSTIRERLRFDKAESRRYVLCLIRAWMDKVLVPHKADTISMYMVFMATGEITQEMLVELLTEYVNDIQVAYSVCANTVS